MPNGRTIAVVVWGFSGLLLTAMASGCLSINSDTSGWQDVARSYKDAYSGSGSERDWAVQCAREAAIQRGLTVDQLAEYSISPSQGEKCWWVEFKHKSREGHRWPERFVARVDMDGKTRIYDHADAPSH